MGRHNKGGGAKKEKIYALRRKLDDFIEEDKKRRDRNVYILERFEKMRSTVALLKSINNNKITENENNGNNLITRNNDRVFMRQDILNYRENHVDDSDILKEITKKYILIPRIYSINRYPVIDIKQSEDVDWRSKYNILDELKKKEREEPPERDIAGHFLQKGSRLYSHNNFRSNDNNINSLSQDNERYNISLPNKNISSNNEVRDEPTSSLLNNNDWKADIKVDEYSNIQNDYKPIHDSKQIENNLNINKDSECIKEALVDISIKVSETNYSDKQDNSIEILKEHEIPKNDHDANTQVIEEIKHETESHPNKENNFDKHYEDINNRTSQLPPDILPELDINKTDLGKRETEQQESFYSESINQNVENSEVHQDKTPETYANDNNYAKDQYNNYYEEPQSQQEKHEPCNNVSQESQEITGSNNQNYEQEHGDSQEIQFNNDNHSENYENYEAHNNYTPEDQNYEYQNVDQQNSKYTNNQISSEPTQETNRNLNENEQNYHMHENGLEFDQQQQIYDQQNYIDSSHGEIQQPYIDNNEVISENITSENLHTTNQEEIYDMQHEYNAQNHGETEQQFYDQQNYIDPSHGEIQQPYIDNNEVFPENNTSENVHTTNQEETYDMQHEYNAQNHSDVGHYVSVQNENDNLQHDYNNQNFNEIYQDNQGAQEVAYDFAAQGQEIQQHDGLGYSEQTQGEFVHYDEDNGLNSQNEIGNLQEDYGDQNIHGIYQEGSLQAQDIQDNVRYDNTPQSNELQHNDANDSEINKKIT